MTRGDKVKWLRDLGFFIAARNPLLNTGYPGRYMVAEQFDAAQLPIEDASNGPWCIVGDDLGALIDEA